jgi:hypothetical protein
VSPAELVAILDEAVGRRVTDTGAVRAALAAILTRHREMVLAERAGCGGPVLDGVGW